ncbi:hypothetical protein IBE71_09730, partial [Francisella tularensis]|uniref:hypothetical protein n=1 Tax=Francisella tularensis TaxID=263 RepID=UPI001C0EDEDE
FGSNLVIYVFILVFIYLAFIALKQEPEYRERIIAFMLLSSACLIRNIENKKHTKIIPGATKKRALDFEN